MKKNPEREIPFVPDATRNKMIKQGKNGETFVIMCVESEFQNQIRYQKTMFLMTIYNAKCINFYNNKILVK